MKKAEPQQWVQPFFDIHKKIYWTLYQKRDALSD